MKEKMAWNSVVMAINIARNIISALSKTAETSRLENLLIDAQAIAESHLYPLD